MFKLVKCVSNNLNEKKYIREASNLVFYKNRLEEGTNNPMSPIDEEKIVRELEKLEVGMRHNNLQVYFRNIIPCRIKQFFLYTFPAILAAGIITVWVLPVNHVKTENLEAFKKTEVTFVDGQQIKVVDDKTYYGVYFNRKYVDSKVGNCHPLEGSDMVYYVTENLEGFKIKARIDSNDSLSVNEATKGEFVDLKEYNEEDLSPIEPKYVELFDKVVDMVVNSSYFNGKDDERLKAITDSEKSRIVGSLITYESMGYQDVEVVKNNWWLRILLPVILGLYDWLIIYLKRDQYCFESCELKNKNGELVDSGDTYDLPLFHLAYQYRELFMAAEKKRIERINDLLEENYVAGSSDKLLTSYEKKLILK